MASAAETADLRSRCRGLLEQSPQSRTVSVRLSRFIEEQNGHKIAPAKQLAPHRPALSHSDREIYEPQDPLIRQSATGNVSVSHQMSGTVHLVRDHQNPLEVRESPPPLGCQACVLGHGSGSPCPINRWVSWRTRSRTSSSSISMLRFPCDGRMLMSEVNSTHPSGPRSG